MRSRRGNRPRKRTLSSSAGAHNLQHSTVLKNTLTVNISTVSRFDQVTGITPRLTELVVDNTCIVSFAGAPVLVSLERFSCRWTPLALVPHLSLMSIIAFGGPALKFINSIPVQPSDQQQATRLTALRPQLTDGFIIQSLAPVRLQNPETRKRVTLHDSKTLAPPSSIVEVLPVHGRPSPGRASGARPPTAIDDDSTSLGPFQLTAADMRRDFDSLTRHCLRKVCRAHEDSRNGVVRRKPPPLLKSLSPKQEADTDDEFWTIRTRPRTAAATPRTDNWPVAPPRPISERLDKEQQPSDEDEQVVPEPPALADGEEEEEEEAGDVEHAKEQAPAGTPAPGEGNNGDDQAPPPAQARKDEEDVKKAPIPVVPPKPAVPQRTAVAKKPGAANEYSDEEGGAKNAPTPAAAPTTEALQKPGAANEYSDEEGDVKKAPTPAAAPKTEAVRKPAAADKHSDEEGGVKNAPTPAAAPTKEALQRPGAADEYSDEEEVVKKAPTAAAPKTEAVQKPAAADKHSDEEGGVKKAPTPAVGPTKEALQKPGAADEYSDEEEDVKKAPTPAAAPKTEAVQKPAAADEYSDEEEDVKKAPTAAAPKTEVATKPGAADEYSDEEGDLKKAPTTEAVQEPAAADKHSDEEGDVKKAPTTEAVQKPAAAQEPAAANEDSDGDVPVPPPPKVSKVESDYTEGDGVLPPLPPAGEEAAADDELGLQGSADDGDDTDLGLGDLGGEEDTRA